MSRQMRMMLVAATLLAVAATVGAFQSESASRPRKKILVELFTSQG